MQVAFIGDRNWYREIISKIEETGFEMIFMPEPEKLSRHTEIGLVFDFRPYLFHIKEIQRYQDPLPVLINQVPYSLEEIQAPENIIRVNGWPGFINKHELELSGRGAFRQKTEEILTILGFKCHWVSDRPGLVSPRVVAMIINEAFLAWEEGVSSREEIDLAMKLGTNYPMGPFEWCRKIGPAHILDLLQKLEKEDNLYKPAKSLEIEAGKEYEPDPSN